MDCKKITSLEIKNMSCGLYGAEEIIAETLKVYRTGKIRHQQFNGQSNDAVNEYCYKVNAAEINSFF